MATISMGTMKIPTGFSFKSDGKCMEVSIEYTIIDLAEIGWNNWQKYLIRLGYRP